MRTSDAFPSKYLNCADLKGREISVTIESVVEEAMRDGTRKPIAYFKGAQKGLALNKTNWSRIAMRYGDESDDWTGAQVTLYPDVTDYQGKPTDCVRVRCAPVGAAKAAPKKAAPPVDDEEPPIDDESIPF